MSCAAHGEGLLDRTDLMKDFDVNTAKCGTFLTVTLQAAVHYGKEYTENLRPTKNHPLKYLRQLFQVTERLITDQTEITGLTTIDWQQPTDRAVQFASAKTYIFSDSVPSGRYQRRTNESLGKQDQMVFGKVILKIWIGSTGNRWSSSGHFPRIHYIGNCRRGS